MGVNSQPLDGWQQYLDQNREAAERAIASLGAAGSTGASFDDEQRRRDIESGARVPLPRTNANTGNSLDDMLRQRIRSQQAAGQSQREREMARVWRETQTEAVLALDRLRWKNYEGAAEFRAVQGGSSERPTFIDKMGWTISNSNWVGTGIMLATDGSLYHNTRGCYELMDGSCNWQYVLDKLRRFAT